MRQTVGMIAAALAAVLMLAGCGEDTPAKDSKVASAPAAKAEKPGDKHADGEEHEGEEHEGEEGEGGSVKLTDAQIALAEIKTAVVARSNIAAPIVLTGEVSLNQERVAHILPRLPGYVRDISKSMGATVKAGETLATLESRDLVELKNNYLVARERVVLAQNKFNREEQLYRQKISPEQEFFDARQALAEANLVQRAAEQNLQSIGFEPRNLAQDTTILYRLASPIAGTIIEWNVALGQNIGSDSRAFVVADLDNLWVMASVNAKDVGRIRVGQAALITPRSGNGEAIEGRVSWVSDLIDEKTRTQKVRVDITNTDRRMKPGMFVTVGVGADTKSAVIAIPASAVQTQKGESIVFVREDDGAFHRREVTLGIRAPGAWEVLSGLKEGETLVTEGSFTLRSELEKAGFEAGHGH
jgi:cobalt-zinc-cadmium efflux system membrane fusion protein